MVSAVAIIVDGDARPIVAGSGVSSQVFGYPIIVEGAEHTCVQCLLQSYLVGYVVSEEFENVETIGALRGSCHA